MPRRHPIFKEAHDEHEDRIARNIASERSVLILRALRVLRGYILTLAAMRRLLIEMRQHLFSHEIEA